MTLLERNAKSVALISAKGGSGKTALAVSMSVVLARMDLKVLLIDFDLATHGASYFFQGQIESTLGLMEAVESDYQNGVSTEDCVVEVGTNFWFVPSKSKLSIMSGVDIIGSEEFRERLSDLLARLQNYAENDLEVDYIILDCQAGAAYATELAIKASSRVVTVLEADRISESALDALRVQYANDLPISKTWRLVDKLHLRDRNSYRDTSTTLRALNYLDPIPFDHDVREAFGTGVLPVSFSEESKDKSPTFLFALVRSMKELFWEEREAIETFEYEYISTIRRRYQEDLNTSVAKRDELRHQLGQFDRNRSGQTSATNRAVIVLGLISVVFASFFAVSFVAGVSLEDFGLPLLLFIVIFTGATALFLAYQNRAEKEQAIETIGMRNEIEARIEDAQKQIERAQSYIYSQSEEFLIDSN